MPFLSKNSQAVRSVWSKFIERYTSSFGVSCDMFRYGSCLLVDSQSLRVEQDVSHAVSDHGDVRLEPVAQLLHLVPQGGPQVLGGVLQALLDVLSSALDAILDILHLRPQQVVEGGDLGLSVVPHLSKVGVQAGLHVIHVIRGVRLEVADVVADNSEGRRKTYV